MAGDSGAQTNQTQETSTLSDLPSWYKNLTEKLGGQMGYQMGGMDQVYNQMMQGGVMPTNGVFNGGATTVPTHAPVNPQGSFGPFTPPKSPPVGMSEGGYGNQYPQGSFGGSGMGSGIGSIVPKK